MRLCDCGGEAIVKQDASKYFAECKLCGLKTLMTNSIKRAETVWDKNGIGSQK